MSDKPRVYQGVRVKTTVKELLQRHRAREANRKKVKTISQACLDLQDLCASTFPSRHVDPPTAAPPADVSSCGARAAASSFPFPDSACNIQMHESVFHDIQQQFGDMMLPSNGYSGNNNHHHHNHNNNNNNNNNASHHGDASCGYGASVPPPPGFPLPWCHGLSSDADYYGLEMAPCSSPESLKLCTPVDHNSYSPQDSFSSSSSSSCYDSPTRMESAHPGFTPEPPAYQSCSLQDCYCPPRCWPGQPDGFSPPEYMAAAAAAAAYHNPTDYHPYACAADDSYFRRDFQMSSEMCYNVL